MLEANPRASRTVPFASKATGREPRRSGVPAGAGGRSPTSACRLELRPDGSERKAAVLPFARFPGADPVLGPEMRSTGEVMASAADFPTAFAKAERAAGRPLPTGGARSLACATLDKAALLPVAAPLSGSGSTSSRPTGTAGRPCGRRLLPVTLVEEGRASGGPPVALGAASDPWINTPEGPQRPHRRLRHPRGRSSLRACRASPRSRSRVPRSRLIEKALAEPARTLQERHAQARAS